MLKWGGLLFVVIGGLIGRSFVIDMLDYFEMENNTVVVEGTVVEFYDNRGEVKHWKANKVTMDVVFDRAGVSDTVNVCCQCGSQYEDPYLSCGQVGDKKKVRIVKADSDSAISIPDLVQVTDSGDYEDSTFSFFILLIPTVMILIGSLVFYRDQDFLIRSALRICRFWQFALVVKKEARSWKWEDKISFSIPTASFQLNQKHNKRGCPQGHPLYTLNRAG